MKKRNKSLQNPILNDFVYTVLYNSSYEQKRGLEGKFLKAAMNEKSAKAFASHSSTDEKNLILSHFGFEYFTVIAKRGLSLEKMKDILTKFESNKKVSALKDLAEEGLIVTSDKEFLRLLGFTSQTIHHPTFFHNLEFLRQGYHIKKWAKRNLNQDDLSIRETDEMASFLANKFLVVHEKIEHSQALFGLSSNQLKILLYLYTKPHTYIPETELWDYFDSSMNTREFKTNLRALHRAYLIQPSVSERKKQYTISGAGTKKVNLFFDNVLK